MAAATNSSVCVYTAIFGGYDDVKPQPPQTIPCDFFCITDTPERVVAPPWRAVAADESSLPGSPPKMQSMYRKALPHRALDEIGRAWPGAAARYDFTIWIDGSVRILRSTFAERMIAATVALGMTALAHPDRDCIYDELEATLGSAAAHKYNADRLREQAAHYRAQGYPAHHGLFACGVLAHKLRDDAVRRVSEAWWDESRRWSTQDQLSLPYVLWRLGAGCHALDLNVWRNPLFEVMPHLGLAPNRERRAARPENATFHKAPNGDEVGVYVPGRGLWRLPAAGSDSFAEFSFGPRDRPVIPLAGDWDGDGVDSPGVYDPATGTFFLRNSCTGGPADVTFAFGPPGAIPFVGDWDGRGHDHVGIFVPDQGAWALAKRNDPGVAGALFHFGAPGTCMTPVAGDWDGRGSDRVGLYQPSGSSWFLLAENTTGADVHVFDFGPDRGVPVVGDWDGDGSDEVGVYVPEQGQAFLAHANRNASACVRALIDPPDSWPIAVRRRGRG